MSLLAASSTAALLAACAMSGQLEGKDLSSWRALQPGIATMMEQNRITGPAVLVDRKGLFVAGVDAVKSPVVQAKLSNGKVIMLRVKALDEPSQIVLLAADDWNEPNRLPIPVAEIRLSTGQPLMAVVGDEPFKASFHTDHITGIMGSQRRVMPLTEIRFEAQPGRPLGGGLLFTMDGHLVGPIVAALDATKRQIESLAPPVTAQSGVGGGGGNALERTAKNDLRQSFGPGPMAVAYTPSVSVTRRVLDGFLSAAGKVLHPYVGIFVRDAIDGQGALVEKVTPGAPAQLNGMMVGDIIRAVENVPIRDQIDFANEMAKLRAGQVATFRLSRGSATINLRLVVGAMQDPQNR